MKNSLTREFVRLLKRGKSILLKDPRRLNHGVADELVGIEVLSVHIHSGNLAVFVGRIVIDAAGRVAAAGIERNFILAAVQLTAAALLLDGMENMEELTIFHVLCGGEMQDMCPDSKLEIRYR